MSEITNMTELMDEVRRLREQLATMTLASRTAVEINHVHEDEIATLREQLATVTEERDDYKERVRCREQAQKAAP